MKQRPEEGEFERWGRAIVAYHLGLMVDRGDDGLANAQPDGLIRDHSETYPLEVVSDTDGNYEAQDKLLKKLDYSFDAPGDPGTIVWVSTKANVRKLKRLIRELLPSLDFDASELLWGSDIPDALLIAGVEGIQRPGGVPGRVLVMHQGWNSWDDDIDFVNWAHRVPVFSCRQRLRRESDRVLRPKHARTVSTLEHGR